MPVILTILVLLALLIGPKYLASNALRRHSAPREYLPGTGGELAKNILGELGLHEVKVELSAGPDHYDPETKTVRLSQNNLTGKSLTAVAVAAHEVGHAIQDHQGYAPLKARTTLLKFAQRIEKLGAIAMMAIPVIALSTRSPSVGLLTFIVALLSLGSGALAHIVTLPVEFDASFNRALPILKNGGYISESDEKDVREILRACAFTYVAGSLASILNVWRWVAILRR
ncbi:hypothetical protein MNBD_NITROSPINAE04-1167 [hydrothermal vent metagenome]|uniref:Metal-dependent peptidase n=1 Tax=hydrothermal vent metagenome TaxID=652676 RepID=A0A3B1BVQ4_9ZZZZ